MAQCSVRNVPGLVVMATSKLIVLTEKLEAGYVSRVGVGSSPDFIHHLHAFRGELRCDQMKNAKQSTLASHGFVNDSRLRSTLS